MEGTANVLSTISGSLPPVTSQHFKGAAYPPSTQPGHPHAIDSDYYPGPQKFNTNVSPSPYVEHSAPSPQAQQHSNSNVVVVQNQPSVTRSPFQSTQDHYLTLGIVLTILCAISGMWHSLLCTVPAIIFSIMARNAEARGNTVAARTRGCIALSLNIGSLVAWIFVIVLIIIAVAVVVPLTSDSTCYRYENEYGYHHGHTYKYYCYK